MGRIDDVLNVSGHRLGTMEIESALVGNPLVAEAAVVGEAGRGQDRGHRGIRRIERCATRGQARAGDRSRVAQLGCEGNRADRPADEIRFGDNLPKTRSGKIMRRLLRTLAKGEEITRDVSTLENPAILEPLELAVA